MKYVYFNPEPILSVPISPANIHHVVQGEIIACKKFTSYLIHHGILQVNVGILYRGFW